LDEKIFVVANNNLHLGRKSVDGRGAYSMKTSGGFVGSIGKFSSGMKFGHGDFHSRNAGDVFVGGNPTTIV